MHFNIRSLQKNFDSSAHYLSVLARSPDVIAISEAKITKNTPYPNITLHGYSFLHHDSETKAEGAAFYIKESLSFSQRNNTKVELPLVEDM